MKKFRYTRFIFLFTAVITVVCQCSLTNSPQKLAGHDCRFSGTYDTDKSTHDGIFDCKNSDGSMLVCPNTNQPATNSKILLINESSAKISDAQFWERLGCSSAAQATPVPTATATPIPTASATSAPAAAGSVQGVSAPLVTGDVTGCNMNDGFINFKLVEGVTPFSGDEVVVVMNGTQVNCSVPSNNTSVLSCVLPAGLAFPAQVSIARGGSMANQFSYNGDACLFTAPPKDQPGNGGESATDAAPTSCTGDC